MARSRKRRVKAKRVKVKRIARRVPRGEKEAQALVHVQAVAGAVAEKSRGCKIGNTRIVTEADGYTTDEINYLNRSFSRAMRNEAGKFEDIYLARLHAVHAARAGYSKL